MYVHGHLTPVRQLMAPASCTMAHDQDPACPWKQHRVTVSSLLCGAAGLPGSRGRDSAFINCPTPQHAQVAGQLLLQHLIGFLCLLLYFHPPTYMSLVP